MWLKQSTAVVISLGPFVDKADGVTLKTGLVSAIDHASTGIFLSKNGGTLTIRHASVTASTYDAYGNYKVTLDTTDTNTLGSLRVQYTDAATCLPVWMDFQILPATVYDALVTNATTAAGGLGDIQRMAGTALTARDIGASVLLSSGTGTGQLSITSGIAKVDVDTIKTNPVVNGGTLTFPSGATLASTTNITAGTITTCTNLTNAATSGDLTATMKTSVTTAATAATPTVLLTAGTSTGQLDFTSGVVKANLAQILGTALTETSGWLAAGFKKFFNVATPVGTINSLPGAIPGATNGLIICGTNANPATLDIVGSINGSLSGSVGSIGSGGIATTSFAAGAIDAAAIATDAIGPNEISAAAANKIADHVRRRTQANVEASADGDTLSMHSLYGFIQQAQNSSTTAHSGKLTPMKTDGTTELGQLTISTDAAADPITGIS
jgi:hypothetical protein